MIRHGISLVESIAFLKFSKNIVDSRLRMNENICGQTNIENQTVLIIAINESYSNSIVDLLIQPFKCSVCFAGTKPFVAIVLSCCIGVQRVL